MASTFFGLTIAYTGLQAASTSVNVTAHNIANINTTGYSRQTVTVKANDAIRTHARYGTLGAGVDVTEINQLRDAYYDDKYRSNEAYYGEYTNKYNYMTQIEDYLNEFSLDGYCTEYKDFFEAVNQLTLTPGDETSKNALINKASSLAEYFNTLYTNLQNVQKDINSEIKSQVDDINTIAQNITALNKQINHIEACYGNANDLRDQRNVLVDNLSKIVNTSVTETSIGNGLTEYNVYINGQALVTSYEYRSLKVTARDDDDKRNASDANGLYDINWEMGEDFNIYSSSLGGTLKGLVDIRDGCNGAYEQVAVDENGNEITDSDGNRILETVTKEGSNVDYKGVPYYMSQINKFVQIFSDAVNKITMSGYTADGQQGEALFKAAGTGVMNAQNICVNSNILKSNSKLPIKSEATSGESDSTLMDALSALQSAKIFSGGTGAYFLESIVSDVSIDSSKATNMQINYQSLKKTIDNQRLSVMGVDTEEEAMNLMKYQQAYNLNSKMMSVMLELYDKLINETGV